MSYFRMIRMARLRTSFQLLCQIFERSTDARTRQIRPARAYFNLGFVHLEEQLCTPSRFRGKASQRVGGGDVRGVSCRVEDQRL